MLLRLSLLLLLAGGAGWTWQHFFDGDTESTDNAYVAGDQVHVAAQVAGRVARVWVTDTQNVQAGQILVELDDTDAQQALNRARAELAQAVQQVRQWQEAAAQSDALTALRQAELAQAESEQQRRDQLSESMAVTREEVERARTQVRLVSKQLEAAQRQAASDHVRVDGYATPEHPLVQIARANFLDAAARSLRNRVLAPVDGVVIQRIAQAGHQIQPGEALLRIVPTRALWVDANFKESQLKALRAGQPVDLTTDTYGSDVHFQGVVVGLSPGTGAAFGVLPAQNAAGNWIKVVQRVPMRVALRPEQVAEHPLQIGLSAHVTVTTAGSQGAPLPQVAGAAALAAQQPPAGAAGLAQAPELKAAAAEADAIVARSWRAAAGPAR